MLLTVGIEGMRRRHDDHQVVGSIGVVRALRSKTAIRCACLGTALNRPMTTVTLVEDLGMAAMAALMLAWGSS